MPRAILLVLFAACLPSCGIEQAREQEADEKAIARITDSLATSGQHGYYVATYLVGRFKNTRLEETMFEVEVGRMDEALLRSPINIQFVDTLGYQLTYDLANERKTVRGRYNEVLLGQDFSLRVSVDIHGRASTNLLRNISMFDYQFSVYPY